MGGTYDNFQEVVGLPGGFVLPNHSEGDTLRTLANLRTVEEKRNKGISICKPSQPHFWDSGIILGYSNNSHYSSFDWVFTIAIL